MHIRQCRSLESTERIKGEHGKETSTRRTEGGANGTQPECHLPEISRMGGPKGWGMEENLSQPPKPEVRREQGRTFKRRGKSTRRGAERNYLDQGKRKGIGCRKREKGRRCSQKKACCVRGGLATPSGHEKFTKGFFGSIERKKKGAGGRSRA